MKVKTMSGVFVALLFVTMPVYAQGQGSKSTADVVAKLQSQLNLTPDQVTSVTPIIEKYISKRKEIQQSLKDGALDKGSMHAQLEQLREDENQELSQILSQDQMSQWSNMQNHTRHKYAAGGTQSSSGTGE